MHVVYERCAAIDVGKDEIAVAARMPGDGPDGRVTVKRTFKTFYGVMGEAARWLVSLGVTHVAMEATGVYSMPVYYALLEHGDFARVLICNAAHVKNVPGRKTDYADAEWLAHLLECGLLAGSFIPPAEIKAARDVIRYRTKVVRQRVSEIARLGNTLQDAGIKTGLGGLVHRRQVRPGDDRGADRRGTPRPGPGPAGQGHDAGQDRGPVHGPGRPLRRPPRPDVPPAPGPHRPPGGGHRPAGRPDRADDGALPVLAGPAGHHPRDRPARRRRGDLRDRRRRPGVLPRRRAPGLLDRAVPRQPPISRQAPLRQAPPRQHPPADPAGRVRLVRGPPRRLPQIPVPPARDEERRLPKRHRQEESHRRGGPRPGRSGSRSALPRPGPLRTGLASFPASGSSKPLRTLRVAAALCSCAAGP